MIFRLPVSREPVTIRAVDGNDEIFLAGRPEDGFRAKVEVVCRLAPRAQSGAVWDELPAADVDAPLLALRRQMLGDQVLAEVTCPSCGSRCDVSFSLGDYLLARAPAAPRGLRPEANGWYVLGSARLRVPTVADILKVEQLGSSAAVQAQALEDDCIDASSRADRRRARAALERVAPLLAGELEGRCAECRAPTRAWFEPFYFVLAELRQTAAAIYEQAHLLASCYGWAEATILALPSARRAQYAELILVERRWIEARRVAV